MLQPVKEGAVLAGKYRVERILAQGGMGIVVLAVHVQLGQKVALKFLLPELCEHGDAVARFLREARAAVRIQGEHMARVTDVGTLESGLPYMVMEYLNGSDLADVLRTQGPLPVATAVDYVLQACEAVAEAHALGIVHRDLKPSNLFLTRASDGSPLVKVLDFGISKAIDDHSSPAITKTSAMLGSPQYMSPEQVRNSKTVDRRTDVWALGAILQELLTGSPPFEGDSVMAILAMIAADHPTPLRKHCPAAPGALEAVVLRCLEKDPTRRFANVSELARAIEPFAASGARASVERIARILGESPKDVAAAAIKMQEAHAPARSTAATWEGQVPARRPGRLRAVLALAILACFGIGAGIMSFIGRSNSLPSSVVSTQHERSVPASQPPSGNAAVLAPFAVSPSPSPSPTLDSSTVPGATRTPSPSAKPPASASSNSAPPAKKLTGRPKVPSGKPASATSASSADKELFDDTQ